MPAPGPLLEHCLHRTNCQLQRSKLSSVRTISKAVQPLKLKAMLIPIARVYELLAARAVRIPEKP
eukprot:12291814-Alexandrium_andersonii.AAC.1